MRINLIFLIFSIIKEISSRVKKFNINNITQYFSIKGGQILERLRKVAGLKPNFSYLEIHLTDHCNLNCRGCGHFAPLVGKKFTDLEEFKRDLKQLKALFSTVKSIVLMGGEPLLHPQVEDFIYATRSIFPKSNIRLYTNGILLPQMPDSFWKACRSCSVAVDITVYPPVKPNETKLIQLVEGKGLQVSTHTITLFHAFFNKKGDTNPDKAFKQCTNRWYNPMLREGKIYVCHKPATIKYFNDKFNLNIPVSGFVDIYDQNIDGWAIKEKLSKTPEICRYCTLGWDSIPVFPWSKSNRVLVDWDALETLEQKDSNN